MKFCLVNGVQQNHIDVDNRGFAYGDGLFTTAKIQQGRIQYLTAHIERLIVGCQRLGITLPDSDELVNQLNTVAKDYVLAVLKVVITAGSGGRGYARASDNKHDVIIMVYDYPQHYDELAKAGINLGLSKQQLGLNPMLAGLKHLNRLEQVLLRQELSTTNNDDLLVTNINNEVVETTSSNVFFFLEGKLHTPSISHSGVNGIMRQAIIARYPETIIQPFTLEYLSQAQSIFTCNCVSGVIPVVIFKGRKLLMGPVKTVREAMINSGSIS